MFPKFIVPLISERIYSCLYNIYSHKGVFIFQTDILILVYLDFIP